MNNWYFHWFKILKKPLGVSFTDILVLLDWTCNYALDLSCPNRKRLEVSKNVKYIAVTLRASKLQVFKVRPGRDLNPGLPRESLDKGKLTHTGSPGSNPGQAKLWRLVTLKPLKLQQCTLHFWKPLIFFYLGKRDQGHSYVLNTQIVFLKIPSFTIVSLLLGCTLVLEGKFAKIQFFHFMR